MATLTAAADGSHLQGAMIALMPAPQDAARLAIEGGEAADQLHLTLYYLGDGDAFDGKTRALITDAVRVLAEGMPPVRSRIFGAAHWNGNGDEPSWVWTVGDDPEQGRSLEAAHEMAHEALLMSGTDVEIPGQYTPWAPHVCAAYSDELDLIIALEERLGPVTFDRVRVAFAGDHTDIPLGGAVTAAAGPLLRRQPTELELASRVDFAAMDEAWRDAVAETTAEWQAIEDAWRATIRTAVQAAVSADDLGRLDSLTVNTDDATELLYARMAALAETAGTEQQREAEDQGVAVPDWSLSDEAMTAAAVRDRLRQIARATANVLGVGLVQAAIRRVMRMFGSGMSGAEAADAVDAQLRALSGASVEEAVGAAMTGAQNEGRMAVLAVAPPATMIASEVLDRNSCKPCRDVDGTEYTTLAAARTAYPAGGYTGCLGGPRCRGTLVAVWDQGETAAGTITPTVGVTMRQQQTSDQGGGAVPYRIVQDHPDCGAETPYAVVLEPDGALQSCHATEGEAEERRAALAAAEDDEMPDGEGMDYAGSTAAWEGVLAVEGIVTGDGREFAEGALKWADLPIPLRWNKEDSHGGEPHTVAVNVGRIDRVWRDGNKVMGAGVLNLAEQDGQRVHDLIKGEFLRGVSIDADSIADADVEFVWPDDVNQGAGEEGEDGLLEMLFAQPEKVIFHGGRIRAATLVDIPAFAEAYVALLDDAGTVVAGGQPVTAEEVAAHQPPAASEPPAVTAAGPWRPPAAWFADPQLSVPTGITVTDDGRLYGHAAQWGACHIGQEGVCVQPPHEDDHPYYMTGELTCDDGTTVPVGQITVGTGHAPLHLAAAPAAEHYDDTGAAVADVAVGNDAHGIWVAGAIRPGIDPARVHELRAAGQVSGDWRRIGGSLRLVGLLAVNVPGFPVPRMRARVASGQQVALVAAGRPTVAHGQSVEEEQARAVRIVMGMLASRVHQGR